MGMEVTVLPIDTSHSLYPEWLALRQRLLRDPIGVTFTETERRAEEEDLQRIALLGSRLVGGLLIRTSGLPPATWKVRQVAVDPEHQSEGIGRILMERAIAEARDSAIERVILHSRESVCGFYRKLGFGEVGETFEEVGIPHRKMVLELAFP